MICEIIGGEGDREGAGSRVKNRKKKYAIREIKRK